MRRTGTGSFADRRERNVCPYCIELHSNKARETGASDPEIAESELVAAALRAGGAITHGTHAMKRT
jgi:AhpD family alkylhydroperoxidase